MSDIKFGPKIWASNFKNEKLVASVRSAAESGLLEVLEVTPEIDSFAEALSVLSSLPLEFIIHAPHHSVGVDWSNRSKRFTNLVKTKPALQYANALKSEVVILHTPFSHLTSEGSTQLSMLNDSRIVIENMPMIIDFEDFNYRGTLDVEMKNILHASGHKGTCLDFSHALSAAIGNQMDPWFLLDRLSELNPRVYHLCDGEMGNPEDMHLPVGGGSYPMARLLSYVPSGSTVILETFDPSSDNIDSFLREADYLRELRTRGA